MAEREENDNHSGTVLITGAGIVGLVLALALHKHVGVKAELYEKVSEFHDGVGAAIGMYPNGLRVLRDISPALLDAIKEKGFAYEYRRWMRHDGTEVAVAKETALQRRDDELHSVGIRRWKLQKILFDAALEAGIRVHFGKVLSDINVTKTGKVECIFEDGTQRVADVLFGADGARSKAREFVTGKSTSDCLRYTGTTCLMGMANLGRPARGICFPSSCTTRCHGAFFPTGENEQCFQFHFPINAERAKEESWGVLGKEEGQNECLVLASRLKSEGWDQSFLEPLHHVSHVVRIGFCLLEPGMRRWASGPVVLLGDAAHPPVPYIGQGAQMGIEDAGVLAQLLKGLCLTGKGGSFAATNFGRVTRVYEKMRIPRTTMIVNNSKVVGREQQRRANSMGYNKVRESTIRLQVLMHGTLPIYLPGVKYDYREDVTKVLLQVKIRHQPTLFTSMIQRKALPPSFQKRAKLQVPNRPMKRISGCSMVLAPIKETTRSIQVPQTDTHAEIVIVGAGIVGLVLALALDKSIGVKAELFEQVSESTDRNGAGVAMYPNCLRVIRDISPALLAAIVEAGAPYTHHEWMTKDSTPEATPPYLNARSHNDLQSIGIRRWKLQKILLDAASDVGIPIHFSKRLSLIEVNENGAVKCSFEDGTHRVAKLLFGADGVKSRTRDFVSRSTSKLMPTSITCVTGLAKRDDVASNISTSVCTPTLHACFFPTGKDEQCFQFHMLGKLKQGEMEPWTELSEEEGQGVCVELASRLKNDDWDESLISPLHHASHVSHIIRVSFCTLQPRLERWTTGPVVLLGDAAHPPVPYAGQGPQMGVEDAGIISQLLKSLCLSDEDRSFRAENFGSAMQVYEVMQLQKAVLALNYTGAMDPQRGSKEDSPISFQMLFRGKLPSIFPGPDADYKQVAKNALRLMQQQKRALGRRQGTGRPPLLANLNTRVSLAA